MKKLTHNTVAALGFAALLLVGACAHNDNLADNNDVTELRPEAQGQEATVAPAPFPARLCVPWRRAITWGEIQRHL